MAPSTRLRSSVRAERGGVLAVGTKVFINTGRHENKIGVVTGGKVPSNLYEIYSEGNSNLRSRFFRVLKTSVEIYCEVEKGFEFYTECGPDEEECECFPPELGVGHDLVLVTGGDYDGYFGHLVGMYNSAHYRVALHGVKGVHNVKVYNCEVQYDIPSTFGEFTLQQKKTLENIEEVSKVLSKNCGCSACGDKDQPRTGKAKKDGKSSSDGSRVEVEPSECSNRLRPGRDDEKHDDAEPVPNEKQSMSQSEDSLLSLPVGQGFRLSIVLRFAKGILGFEGVSCDEISK